MMTIEVFHFDEGRENFESLGQSNGGRFWFARDLMQTLGYESFVSFHGAIQKAIATSVTLGIPIENNFIVIQRELGAERLQDYKLSRFACYLTAMNGDVAKPEVAAAQAYFISLAERIRDAAQGAGNVERVLVREDVSDHERSLSGVAKSAGVKEYGLFQNAGYRGLYNMDYGLLKRIKGVPESRSLLDFMGKEELAANLFRITQTEAKIKNERLTGQFALERAAAGVGQKVRAVMQETSGNRPEALPPAEDITAVKSKLKRTHKEFKKLDKGKRSRLGK